MQDSRRSYRPPPGTNLQDVAGGPAPSVPPQGYADPYGHAAGGQHNHDQQGYSQPPAQPSYPPAGQQRQSYAPSAAAQSGGQPEAARRARPREGRDLFANQGEDLGRELPQEEQRLGERAENSVLFTLDSLKATSKSSASQASPQSTHAGGAANGGATQNGALSGHLSGHQGQYGMQQNHGGMQQNYAAQASGATPAQANFRAGDTGEDASGTIDLLALARAGGSALKVQPMALQTSSFAEYMQQPAAASAAPAPKQSSGLLIGLGAALTLAVAGIAAGGWVLLGKSAATVRAAEVTASTELVSAMAITLPKLERPAEPVAATRAPGRGGNVARAPGRAPGAGAAAPAAPPPVHKPASDPCHCGGNLSCVMRCSTK